MAKLNQLICPVSTERVDENRVRATAFGVLIIISLIILTKNPIFPLFLVLEVYIRAFTRYKFSPLSWLAFQFVKAIGTQPVWIDKAPKMFAARVGLVLSSVVAGASLLSMPLLAMGVGGTLVIFSFLECGLNFCAGCWVYTYLVYPMVRKKQ